MVYILHFSEPLAHARHYVGFCEDGRLNERLAEHRAGTGAAILRECNRRGITYQVARTMPGDRSRERQIKRGKCTPRYCPVCRKRHHKN